MRPGDKVAINLTNRPEYLETFYAAFKLGAVPVNVNYRYGAEEIRYLLDDSDAKVVVTEAAFAKDTQEGGQVHRAPGRQEVRAGRHRGRRRARRRDRDGAAAMPPSGGPGLPSGDDLMFLYTGGTTGMPKGVMWRNDDLYVALWQMGRPGTEPPDPIASGAGGQARAATALPACPLMHGTGLFITLSTLAGGGTVVLHRRRRAGRAPHLGRGRAQRASRCSRSWATCSPGRCSPRSTPSPTAGTSRACGRSRRAA